MNAMLDWRRRAAERQTGIRAAAVRERLLTVRRGTPEEREAEIARSRAEVEALRLGAGRRKRGQAPAHFVTAGHVQHGAAAEVLQQAARNPGGMGRAGR